MELIPQLTQIFFRKNIKGETVYSSFGPFIPAFVIPDKIAQKKIELFVLAWLFLNFLLAGYIFSNMQALLSKNLISILFIILSFDYLVIFIGSKILTSGFRRDEQYLIIELSSLKYRKRNLIVGSIFFILGVALLITSIFFGFYYFENNYSYQIYKFAALIQFIFIILSILLVS